VSFRYFNGTPVPYAVWARASLFSRFTDTSLCPTAIPLKYGKLAARNIRECTDIFYSVQCEPVVWGALQHAHWADLLSTSETDEIQALTETERKRREAVWELFQSECVFLIDHLMVLKHVSSFLLLLLATVYHFDDDDVLSARPGTGAATLHRATLKAHIPRHRHRHRHPREDPRKDVDVSGESRGMSVSWNAGLIARQLNGDSSPCDN